MSKTNYRKLAVIQALQYIETRALNPKEFLEFIEGLYQFYIKDVTNLTNK
jgi:hypothetical protein